MDRICAKCRLSSQKLFLKGERCFTVKCPFTRRSYAPGIHGQAKHGKPTDYGLQLREKQRVKWTYGLRERQFHNIYEAAINKTGNTGDIMATFLEMRLDNVLYRLGIGKSHSQARQIISHKHVLLNGKPLNIPSYTCKVGDTITFKKTAEGKLRKATAQFLDSLPAKQKPDWIVWDAEKFLVTIARPPKVEELPTQFNMRAIVEFYSR